MSELDKISTMSTAIAELEARLDLARVERAKLMAAANKTSSTHVIGAAAGMSHVNVLRVIRDCGPGTKRAKDARALARKLGVTASA